MRTEKGPDHTLLIGPLSLKTKHSSHPYVFGYAVGFRAGYAMGARLEPGGPFPDREPPGPDFAAGYVDGYSDGYAEGESAFHCADRGTPRR